MRLQLFRNHLAAELSNLPDIRSQEVQSYALTTAILVRKIVERLEIDNLEISSVHDSQRPTYSLKTILNDLIHYRAFHPEFQVPGDNSSDCIVRLYSTKTRKKGVLYCISLRAYFDLISQLVHDDLFVANHLLRRVITNLSQALNTDRKFDADFLSDTYDLISDALTLAAKLDRDNTIRIQTNVFVDWYKPVLINPSNLQEGFNCSPGPRVNTAEFVHGFNTVWRLAPFKPSREKLEGVDVYSFLIEEIEYKEDGRMNGFYISFGAFLSTFQAIKKQCETG